MNNQPVAYLMPGFLEGEEARPIRILAEYMEPLHRFSEQNIQDTVVFFGSARAHSRVAARRAMSRLAAGGRRLKDANRKAYVEQLRRLKRAMAWSRYYEDARELARLLTTWSLTLKSPSHRFVVCSGGGPGVMEAANRGAREAGGKTIGLNIRLQFEQGPNRYITEGLHFEFHYFFMRKFWFAHLATALVIFPGGFGTLDELFEFLTLTQTHKLSKKIEILLYGKEYWSRVLNLKSMAEWGAVAAKDLALLHQVDDPREAFDLLKRHLVKHHLLPGVPREDRSSRAQRR